MSKATIPPDVLSVRTSEPPIAWNLLNDQDLDKLNNAIRSTEHNMASLGESSRNTLNSLQDELDELQGRQSDIEQRRYQSQRDDLKAQQAEAIAKGDQETVKILLQPFASVSRFKTNAYGKPIMKKPKPSKRGVIKSVTPLSLG